MTVYSFHFHDGYVKKLSVKDECKCKGGEITLLRPDMHFGLKSFNAAMRSPCA